MTLRVDLTLEEIEALYETPIDILKQLDSATIVRLEEHQRPGLASAFAKLRTVICKAKGIDESHFTPYRGITIMDEPIVIAPYIPIQIQLDTTQVKPSYPRGWRIINPGTGEVDAVFLFYEEKHGNECWFTYQDHLMGVKTFRGYTTPPTGWGIGRVPFVMKAVWSIGEVN